MTGAAREQGAPYGVWFVLGTASAEKSMSRYAVLSERMRLVQETDVRAGSPAFE